jgi:hypothetical protein
MAQGFPMKKEEDLMIHFMSIEEELPKTKDEQLYKLLSYSFVILNLLIKNISLTMKSQETVDGESAPES